MNMEQIIQRRKQEFERQRDEAMRQYQAAHGAVQAMEQLLVEIKQEEENGK